jgi:hypothetical protein
MSFNFFSTSRAWAWRIFCHHNLSILSQFSWHAMLTSCETFFCKLTQENFKLDDKGVKKFHAVIWKIFCNFFPLLVHGFMLIYTRRLCECFKVEFLWNVNESFFVKFKIFWKENERNLPANWNQGMGTKFFNQFEIFFMNLFSRKISKFCKFKLLS